MRLFQLARKLEVTPESIIALLADHEIAIENKSNIKLAEGQVALVLEHFSKTGVFGEKLEPSPGEEPAQQPVTSEFSPVTEEEEIVSSPQTVIEEEKSEIALEESPLDMPTVTKEEQKEVEVIRVKKIKLSGPKVLGKIELPEPVKKERTIKENQDALGPKRERNRYRNRDRWSRGNRRETLEQKRQREAREKAKTKKHEERVKKEKRKKFYKEHIQASPVPRQNKKRIKKAGDKTNPIAKREVAKPKNPLKRLWLWLNGEYDRY